MAPRIRCAAPALSPSLPPFFLVTTGFVAQSEPTGRTSPVSRLLFLATTGFVALALCGQATLASATGAGACCLSGGACEVLTSEDCDLSSGTYQGDFVECEVGLCEPPIGACCVASGSCMLLTEPDCVGSEGDFLGVQIECEPSPCPTPNRLDTWGRIKELFLE